MAGPAAALDALDRGELGLDASLDEHDLTALRAAPDHPGEEAPRTELVSATVTPSCASSAPTPARSRSAGSCAAAARG